MLEAKLINALIYALITATAFFNAALSADNNKSFFENATAILVYSFQEKENPCSITLTYTIGAFDDRFRISRDEFRSVIDESAAAWNAASNKKLFVYSPDGELKVNLVYDARQETAQKIQKQEPMLEEMQKKGEALDAKYDQTAGRAEKEQIQKEHDALADTYNGMLDDYTANAQKLGERFTSGQYEENENGKMLNIYTFSNRQKLKRLLVHEFGHSLGLGHSNNEGDIMFHANVATNETPTVGDIASLKRICGMSNN